MMVMLELGYLDLHDGNLSQARARFLDGLQVLIQANLQSFTGFSLDGLALLALREGKLERAAQLFGTRLWRGFAHTLSPIERTEREADFTALRTALGVERFEQLREEGRAMSFIQVLALAQEG
jgi:hypothetical protein